MKSNFAFLDRYWSGMAELGMEAECQLFYDNSACILKLGTFAEQLIDEILCVEGLQDYLENNQYEKITLLEEKELLPENIKSIFHRIRILRNKVGHENEKISDKRAERCLIDAYNLAGWFAVVYCHKGIVVPEYRTPNYDELLENGDAQDSAEEDVCYAPNVRENEGKSVNLNPVLLVAFIVSVVLNVYLICR